MRQFLLGHASGHKGSALVEACLDQIGEIPGAANFGFIYATDALASELRGTLAMLKAGTGIEHWTGTIGVGISATAREYYEQPALAVMIASFPEGACRTLRLQRGGTTVADEGAGRFEDPETSFGILHGDPSDSTTQDLLAGLDERWPGAFFVGGLTSSNAAHLQVADSVISGGLSGVLFSSAIEVATSHTQGCTPIAGSHVITACQRNILVELDGRPALEVFQEDVGEVIARDLNRAGGYIFAGFPIRGSDTGDYIVRNLLGIDRGKKLIAVGELLAEQSEILFCRRDGNSARADLVRMLDGLKRRLRSAPKGAVYYSCLGRGRYQFGPDSAELNLIREELGDVPLVGFFANGEIFHNRLYAYTGVLTLFC